MATNANSPPTCPTNAIDANLPIPNNITYTVIPGTNASVPWMVNCCAPNPVNVVETCWLWCEITSGDMASFNISDPDKNIDLVQEVFAGCLIANHRDLNVSNAHETVPKGAASRRGAGMGTVEVVAMVCLVGWIGHSLF